MELILTTKGEMPLDSLERLDGQEESPDALVRWTEYRIKGGDGEVVRRDCHVEIKTPLPMFAHVNL